MSSEISSNLSHGDNIRLLQTEPLQMAATATLPTISITHGYDDAGTTVGNFFSGETVDDTTPTLYGQTVPNGYVRIYVDNFAKGYVTADASGNWSFTLKTLSSGSHTIKAELLNSWAKDAVSENFIINVGVAAPSITTVLDGAGVMTGPVGQNGWTDDTRPEIRGTAEAGHVVKIYDGATLLGSTVADSAGVWSFTPKADMGLGTHNLVAQAENAQGNVSAMSSPWVVTVVAPPSITHGYDSEGRIVGTFTSGEPVDDTNPTLHGKAAPNGIVKVYVDNVWQGDATTDASGNWSYRLSGLSEGSHAVSVELMNGSTLVSKSKDFVILVDTTAPDAPTLAPLPDATNENPTLVGTGTPGETIVIRDNGQEIGTAIVGEDGAWSFIPNPVLGEGEHSLTAEAVDEAGNVSLPSAPGIVLIDTTAPETPTLNTLPGATNENPILGGTGTAGDTVVIRDNGTEIGSAVVREDGTWSFTPNPALEEGEHRLTVEAADAAGNVSTPSAPGIVLIDTTAPDAPTLNALPGTTNKNPPLGGTGAAGDTIVIRDNGNKIGTAVVDANGIWSFTPSPALSEGKHSLTAEAVDAAGNVSISSVPRVVLIDTTAPDQPVLSLVDATNDTTPTLGGSGLQVGERVIVYDNGIEIGFTIVDGGGRWSFTPTEPMSEGEHAITIVVMDQAGNASVPSEPEVIIIDITPPDRPTLEVPDVTADTTPTLNGGGIEPGERVIIRDNGIQIGSVVADRNGNWSYTPAEPMAEGKHTITIVVVDAAGNASVPSEPGIMFVDSIAPTQRTTVTYMTKDTGFSQSDLITNDGGAGRLVQGNLSSALSWDERLQVSTDGGTTWLNALVNGTDWAFQDNNAHSASWTIQTRVVDRAGNVGVTDSHAVTLGASAPAAPKSLSISDKKVTVNLQGSVAGDKVLLVSDLQRAEHVLTTRDISLGYVEFTLPYRAITAYAAIESNAGGMSAYTHAQQVGVVDNIFTGGYGSYKFTETQIAIGKITATPGLAAMNAYTSQEVGNIEGLIIGGYGTNNGTVQIDFRYEVQNFNMAFLYNAQLGKVRFQFYDANNNLLADMAHTNSNSASIAFKAGTGAPAAYMKIVVTNETDGFRIGQMTVDFVPVVHDPSTHEVVKSFSYVGNAGIDTFVVADTSVFTGFTGSIVGGNGTDILKLTGAGQIFDLTALGNKMSSVEVVDITGTGNNTLKLSLSDVLGQGSMDLFHTNGDVQMMIKGNAGDSVMLEDKLSNGITPGVWGTGGTITVEGVTYISYQYSTMDAELLVQQGVQVNLV